jgi:hypothetical protein
LKYSINNKITQFGKVTVESVEEKIITYQCPFERLPRVTVTLKPDASHPAVNCFLSDVSGNSFTVKFSSSFTGEINYIAIEE